jgi:hypothetical protein
MDGGNENAPARTGTGARGRHARFDDLIRRSDFVEAVRVRITLASAAPPGVQRRSLVISFIYVDTCLPEPYRGVRLHGGGMSSTRDLEGASA